jgi:hypothetical protein
MEMTFNQHPTLICSLPRLPGDFEQPYLPISRPRLESRLSMLTEAEQEIIKLLERFWRWEATPVDENPQELYTELLRRCSAPGLRECLEVLADIRLLSVALRARKAGKKIDAPLGRWGPTVLRNWELPDFGLGLRFPWLAEIETFLNKRQYLRAERKVCQTVWQEMSRIADRHYFDLAFIFTYLVRWDLINRWAVRDPKEALGRFNTLVKEVIGTYAGKIE